MKVKEIIAVLEALAPPSLQETYDNSGLIAGNYDMEVTGSLICLDSTEAVVDEAIAAGYNLIIAHHPIIFSGLKKLNGKNFVERTIIKAIKHDVAIYAIHTNLDNVFSGVNRKICERIGLQNLTILSPLKNALRKLVTFVPHSHEELVRKALFDAGAGRIGNYDECSFNTDGKGTYRPNEQANPFAGEKGKRHGEPEVRIEVIYETHFEQAILSAMKAAHPYEEVAYDLVPLINQYQYVGAGMVGELPQPMPTIDFLNHLKSKMLTNCIRYTKPNLPEVKKIAVCGGSGSFLLPDAINCCADVFVTADFKYHQFFDADGRIIIADIGHYESEQFTAVLLWDLLKEKFPTFAVRLSEINTNPVNYL